MLIWTILRNFTGVPFFTGGDCLNFQKWQLEYHNAACVGPENFNR